MIMDQEAMCEYPSLLSATSHSFCSAVIAGMNYSAQQHIEKKVPSVAKYVVCVCVCVCVCVRACVYVCVRACVYLFVL